MKAAHTRNGFLLLIVLTALSASLHVAAAKVERTSTITVAGVSDSLRAAVESKGYKVTLDDGWTAEFWFVKDLKTTKKDAPGALYTELTNGEFVGVVNFPQGMSDFRGQAIPVGLY